MFDRELHNYRIPEQVVPFVKMVVIADIRQHIRSSLNDMLLDNGARLQMKSGDIKYLEELICKYGFYSALHHDENMLTYQFHNCVDKCSKMLIRHCNADATVIGRWLDDIIHEVANEVEELLVNQYQMKSLKHGVYNITYGDLACRIRCYGDRRVYAFHGIEV